MSKEPQSIQSLLDLLFREEGVLGVAAVQSSTRGDATALSGPTYYATIAHSGAAGPLDITGAALESTTLVRASYEGFLQIPALRLRVSVYPSAGPITLVTFTTIGHPITKSLSRWARRFHAGVAKIEKAQAGAI